MDNYFYDVFYYLKKDKVIKITYLIDNYENDYVAGILFKLI